MSEAEGVIKYQLDFNQNDVVIENIEALNVWRSILYDFKMIGQQTDKYLGYGYGNVSQRCADNALKFLVSASQTGYMQKLKPQHYSLVDEFDIATNSLRASGRLPPSSEALSHAMIYKLKSSTSCVLHIHDPVLWHFGLQHNYPATDAAVEYGTTKMAQEVERLFLSTNIDQLGVLIMAGHEDGVIVFGDNVQQAGARIIQLWLAAHKLI